MNVVVAALRPAPEQTLGLVSDQQAAFALATLGSTSLGWKQMIVLLTCD